MKRDSDRMNKAALTPPVSVQPFAGGILNKYKAGASPHSRFGKAALAHARRSEPSVVQQAVHVKVTAPKAPDGGGAGPNRKAAPPSERTVERTIEREKVIVERHTIVLRDVTRVIREQRTARELAVTHPVNLQEAAGTVTKRTKEQASRMSEAIDPNGAAKRVYPNRTEPPLTPGEAPSGRNAQRADEYRRQQDQVKPGIVIQAIRKLERLHKKMAKERVRLLAQPGKSASSRPPMQLANARRAISHREPGDAGGNMRQELLDAASRLQSARQEARAAEGRTAAAGKRRQGAEKRAERAERERMEAEERTASAGKRRQEAVKQAERAERESAEPEKRQEAAGTSRETGERRRESEKPGLHSANPASETAGSGLDKRDAGGRLIEASRDRHAGLAMMRTISYHERLSRRGHSFALKRSPEKAVPPDEIRPAIHAKRLVHRDYVANGGQPADDSNLLKPGRNTDVESAGPSRPSSRGNNEPKSRSIAAGPVSTSGNEPAGRESRAPVKAALISRRVPETNPPMTLLRRQLRSRFGNPPSVGTHVGESRPISGKPGRPGSGVGGQSAAASPLPNAERPAASGRRAILHRHSANALNLHKESIVNAASDEASGGRPDGSFAKARPSQPLNGREERPLTVARGRLIGNTGNVNRRSADFRVQLRRMPAAPNLVKGAHRKVEDGPPQATAAKRREAEQGNGRYSAGSIRESFPSGASQSERAIHRLPTASRVRAIAGVEAGKEGRSRPEKIAPSASRLTWTLANPFRSADPLHKSPARKAEWLNGTLAARRRSANAAGKAQASLKTNADELRSAPANRGQLVDTVRKAPVIRKPDADGRNRTTEKRTRSADKVHKSSASLARNADALQRAAVNPSLSAIAALKASPSTVPSANDRLPANPSHGARSLPKAPADRLQGARLLRSSTASITSSADLSRRTPMSVTPSADLSRRTPASVPPSADLSRRTPMSLTPSADVSHRTPASQAPSASALHRSPASPARTAKPMPQAPAGRTPSAAGLSPNASTLRKTPASPGRNAVAARRTPANLLTTALVRRKDAASPPISAEPFAGTTGAGAPLNTPEYGLRKAKSPFAMSDADMRGRMRRGPTPGAVTAHRRSVAPGAAIRPGLSAALLGTASTGLTTAARIGPMRALAQGPSAPAGDSRSLSYAVPHGRGPNPAGAGAGQMAAGPFSDGTAMPALAHHLPKQAAAQEPPRQVQVEAPRELDPDKLQKMIMRMPQLQPEKIADQVYKALERKMKLEQRRRGY
ncbi:hypothetical protein [Paenibacillus arenilitoris]|uniref:Uncharacterized protein n=1 Tax=Paenibacillus arenilitoris TaxID=2772299 RepID=A0A927H4K6_9BACL|nr:hypothetical protein [Paenibacillus arenilitoris]MBD2867588.1 hypothetical protein [Paenibacillus arenilitoris]